jgi:hypothetical protein
MRNESLSQGQNDGRDDSVLMSDITYAAVETVRFMNPKIRTKHQRPNNKLSRTPFDRCCIGKAEVEMMYKVTNANGIDTLHSFFSTGSATGGAKLEVLRSGQIPARRRRSCYSADKRNKQKASIDPGQWRH